MSNEENQPQIQNESNLLQSTVNPDDIPIKPEATHSFDDIPIGGKKFDFSEFPQEGQMPKQPKKPFKPRASKASKKPQPEVEAQKPDNQQNKKNQSIQFDQKPLPKSSENTFDQQPIGGKKFEFSQYPQQGQPPPQPKKSVQPRTKAKTSKKPEPVPSEPPSNPVNVDQMPIGGAKGGTAFDEMAIGKGNSNAMMSEFPEGQQQAPVETNYTMSQKLKSKAVKLRLSGMQDLLKLLEQDPNSPDIAQVQLPKLLKQTNPACLEKILQCFKIWVQKQKKWGDDQAKSAIENGYINGKPNTKKLTVQITDLMYQKSSDTVQMTILVGLKGKVPKTLAGYIGMINELLAIYGMKRMKYMKPYISDVVTILNREKLVAVKTQGMNLLKQSYKWLTKQVMDPLLKDLKQNLKKELDSFWQTYDKTQVMSAPKDIPDQAGGKTKKKVDAYQLSQAVDIFKKFNEKFSDQVIKQQKWSEKVKLMQDFVNAANVPKIANTQYRHITQMIRRLINHSNFNVVLWDLKILAVLAKGLRRPFYPVVKSLFSNVIGKFRDKKTQMVQQTFNTLNQFSYCISIEDVLDDIKQGLTDKAPNMKVNLINWLGKFVEKKVQQKQQLPDKASDALRSLFPSFEKLLSDGVADVRDTMAKNIGKMKILLGDDFFAQVDKKMSKGQANKAEEVKKQMPTRKVSRDKQKKQKQKDTPMKKNSKIKQSQNNSLLGKGKQDLNQQISILLPKLNHSDWQKRKDSAEAIENLLSNQDKLNIACLGDFLNTLKTRIADPNKQLVKVFVHLTGVVFTLLSDREVKANAKNFICALADGLSDKVEANRKQICVTLNKLGQIYGRQHLVSILGPYLEIDKDSRIQIINVILQNEDYIPKADTRDYPKGLIKCLCDRNKQIRRLAQQLFDKVQQKTGLDVFKNLARNERPAIAKDLNALFAKYEGGGGGLNNNSSVISGKGNSPPHKKAPPLSNRKPTSQRSLGKSQVHQKSFDRDIQTQDHQPMYATMTSVGSNILKQTRTYVKGNSQFASLDILGQQRVQRQEKDERYPWMCDIVLQSQQQELTQSITMLIRPELGKKMLSMDYRKVIQATSHIIKLCKDISHQNEIRQLYDIFIKWVFVRLWGGNPAIQSIIQVLLPVMSILEKKKLAINQSQVDVVVAILRQYIISGFMNQYKVSDSIYNITNCLIALSSGDKLLVKLFRQFGVQLTNIHKHIRREATTFYREGLSKLIKSHLMQYIGHGNTLQQASRIKELKNDAEFVDMLYKRLNQKALDSYGFRQNHQQHQTYHEPPMRQQPQVAQSSIHPPRETAQPQVPQQVYRSTVQKRNQPPSEPPRRPARTPPQRNSQQQHNNSVHQASVNKKSPQSNVLANQDEDIDISIYPMPHPASPLGKNLAKMMPPNDATVSFFNTLFSQTGQKIANQLSTHAKVIFGTILKSVMVMLQNRSEIPPEKILGQINLLQQSIKCKHIIANVGQLLYHGTKFALTQLVYQDENKNLIMQDLQNRGIDFRVQQFIKVINGVMLRILQNSCPQKTINILLRLLNYHCQQQYASQKTAPLIIKCFSRVVVNYANQINESRTRQYFIRALEYFNIVQLDFQLQQFNPPPQQRLRPDQTIIKNLKTVIDILAKHYNEQVWVHYEAAMKNSKYPDNYIAPFLQYLAIPYPQNIQEYENQEDQQLKEINQLLSKKKTFDIGIQQLKRYVAHNQGFSPVQYFSSRGFDQKFIIMVMNSLEEKSQQKRTPTKRELRQQRSQNSRRSETRNQPNIQERIQKLKMRFDQIQPNQQQKNQDARPSNQRQPPPSNRPEEQRNQERALQIKRRIDEMKNRMNRK